MTLWTPGGEHQVPREPADAGPHPDAGGGSTPTAGGAAPSLEDLDPEERARAEQIMAELADARERLAETPVDVVIANHVMGFYELAAIHLNREPAALDDARTAIDAMGAVLNALEGRLGEPEAPLREALNQVQLAYVQLARQAKQETAEAPSEDPREAE